MLHVWGKKSFDFLILHEDIMGPFLSPKNSSEDYHGLMCCVTTAQIVLHRPDFDSEFKSFTLENRKKLLRKWVGTL